MHNAIMDQPIHLIIDGIKVDAQIETKSKKISKHTGKEIELLELYFDVDEKSHDSLQLNLSNKANFEITSVNNEGTILKKWKTTSKVTSDFPLDNPIFTYHLEIEELENLQLTELIIDNCTIKPYFYLEDFDCDVLTINAKMQRSTTNEVDLNALYISKKGVFFPVVRLGINEKPVEMRFGQVYWSENDGGNKYSFTLVEKGYDERQIYDFNFFNEEIIKNLKVMACNNSEIINQLIKLLVEKELISQEEKDNLQTEMKSNLEKRLREIYLIPDVDKIEY